MFIASSHNILYIGYTCPYTSVPIYIYSNNTVKLCLYLNQTKLEQLECLRSEDTPCRLMITHTIESYWIPSEKKIKIFLIFKQSLHTTHLLKLLDKMCKYEMDPTSIVEDTERKRFCPQMDRRADGQMDEVKSV